MSWTIYICYLKKKKKTTDERPNCCKKALYFNCGKLFVPGDVYKKLFQLEFENNEERDENEARDEKIFYFGTCKQVSTGGGKEYYNIEKKKKKKSRMLNSWKQQKEGVWVYSSLRN